ncbi:MAG: type I DNA topoisomerase [Sphingobacteriales bacterium]|nr:type I DNA topoisomerase [Sphingobacteriales bacterium]
MSKNLVIVESPAKAKTIEKFLGKDFKVMSCNGHVRDLHPNELSIDLKKNFEPKYFLLKEKTKLINDLKKAASGSETIWLATDEDREGEAISWHLTEVLNLQEDKTKRIVFHEITKNAILHAIENPRYLDYNLVNAQQARRVIDRLVGYQVSPILWKKVKPSLSAGRVQSVAVRLIVEREREINSFTPSMFVKVYADFESVSDKTIRFRAELPEKIDDLKLAEKFLKECIPSKFTVESVEKKPGKKSPPPPFTTSTLQQEASRKLGFSVSQTMQLAQKLYEAGHITYMRTDSVRLFDMAIGVAKEVITEQFGKEYSHTRNFQTKSKGAQEAHEAIRPTFLNVKSLDAGAQEKKLYELIWKRTIASQMSDARIEKTTVKINVSESKRQFVANGEVLLFDGFLKLYVESEDDENPENGTAVLPALKTGENLIMIEALAAERYTKPPVRYNEAMLVKKLEELGIGRPSTYAPTISTIMKREYIIKGNVKGKERTYHQLVLKDKTIREEKKSEIYGFEKGKLLPSPVGVMVNDFLVEHFKNIMDYHFTANIEDEFDKIAEGSLEWRKMIELFYKDFTPVVETASKVLFKSSFERLIGVDPATGKKVYAKSGKYGPYVQLGESNDKEKAKNAPMKKGQLPESISLEEALELFKIPRVLGEYEGKPVTVNIGRFGPYLEYNAKNISLPRKYDPYSVELNDAIQVILSKQDNESEPKSLTFMHEGEEMKILRGRFGPYISFKKKNYKIPRGKDYRSLTLAECLQIINEAVEKQKTSSEK